MTPTQKSRFEDLEAWAHTHGMYIEYTPEKFALRSADDGSSKSGDFYRLSDVREALAVLASEKKS